MKLSDYTPNKHISIPSPITENSKYRYIYLVRFNYKEEKIIKIGVASNPKNRFYKFTEFATINNFEILYTGKVFHGLVYLIETAFLNTWKKYNKNISNGITGSTEWHSEFDVILAIKFLRKAVNEAWQLESYYGRPFANFKYDISRLKKKYTKILNTKTTA